MKTPHQTPQPRRDRKREARNAAAFSTTRYLVSLLVPHLLDVLNDPEATPAAVLAVVDPALTMLGSLRGLAFMVSRAKVSP